MGLKECLERYEEILTEKSIKQKKYPAIVKIKKEYSKKAVIEYFEYWQLSTQIAKENDFRSPNLPCEISEGIVAILLNGSRNGTINGADLIINNEQIEIKGSSVEDDLSTFSPRESETQLYFVKVNPLDGTYIIYDKFSIKLLYPIIVTKGKKKGKRKQTFKEQMDAGRRPRLSLFSFVKYNNIPILFTGNIKDI